MLGTTITPNLPENTSRKFSTDGLATTKETSTHLRTMPLLPPEPDQPKTESPAVRLRRKHIKVSGGQYSSLKDFNELLKTYSYADIDKMLTWLRKQPESVKNISSSLLRHKYKELLAQQKNALDDYPISETAKEVLGRLENTIEPQYIQHCMDTYDAFVSYLKQKTGVAETLVTHLPPASEFAFLWFERICGTFSPKFRKFEVNHPKFQQFLHGIAKSQGESLPFVRLMNEYNDTNGSAPKA
jgi:hypothetical protein